MTNEKQLTAAGIAKSYGFKSLNEMAAHVNKSLSCLHGWYHNNPELFHSACLGASIRKGAAVTKFAEVVKQDRGVSAILR